MNVLTGRIIGPNPSFPFFEEYSRHKTLCKVYNDGNCYVGIPQGMGIRKKKHTSRVKTRMDFLFQDLYLTAIKENMSKNDTVAYIKAGLSEAFPEALTIDDFISNSLKRVHLNLLARKKRFRRKAYLNRWNYFVTFTYDDDKHDEESFRKGLRKCLSNFHTRRGWYYMGVWERAPETQRLHFHAIVYVPEGQMPGELYERKDYSTKHRRHQITHPNTFFEERFGRCDFEALSDIELRHGNTIKYLLKYLEKTDERIIYSRGIPSEFFKVIEDDDVVCEMLDYVLKLVLFNDVIDYEADVLHKPKLEEEWYIPILPPS